MFKRQKEVLQYQLSIEDIILDKLEKQYERALNDINEKIKLYQADMTQSRIRHIQYQEMLKEQVEATLDKLHADEYRTIQQYLDDSYTDAFIGVMYDLHGQNMPIIAPIDRKAAVKAILTDTKLTSPLYKRLGLDLDAIKETISQEITRGIASGMMFADIARNISNVSGVPLSSAKGIVRTEGHRIQQASAEDARQAAKAAGGDVVKQWDATMDGATRDEHRLLDGQIREVDEPFTINGKKAMYPGGFGDPGQDCNCRCVALTRARKALDPAELDTLKGRAAFFGLDKTKDFETFKEKYQISAETLKNQGKYGIIKEGENWISHKGFTIHQDKIQKFLLQPGAKHYEEFHDVGYRPGEHELLALTIEKGYDESKATNVMKNENGSERFSIFMTLGFTGNKRFRTVWQKDTPNSKPRLITAHRE